MIAVVLSPSRALVSSCFTFAYRRLIITASEAAATAPRFRSFFQAFHRKAVFVVIHSIYSPLFWCLFREISIKKKSSITFDRLGCSISKLCQKHQPLDMLRSKVQWQTSTLNMRLILKYWKQYLIHVVIH